MQWRMGVLTKAFSMLRRVYIHSLHAHGIGWLL